MGKTKVEEIFDKYAKDYSGDFAPPRYTTARAAMSFADDITWHFLTKYLPRSKSIKILDAGGGDGSWAQRLVESGYKNIVVADISQGMLDEAEKRFAQIRMKHNAKFVKSDIMDMKEFGTACFDFVFSQYDAVSYCLKPAEAIKELARVAKKGAYVIVSLDTKFRRVPELIEAGKIGEAEKLLNTNISYDFDFSQYNLTWEELSDCFEKAGLFVLEAIGAPVFMHQVKGQILRKLEANPNTRKRLVQIELAHCTNKSLVNFAGHLQMVGQKPWSSENASETGCGRIQKRAGWDLHLASSGDITCGSPNSPFFSLFWQHSWSTRLNSILYYGLYVKYRISLWWVVLWLMVTGWLENGMELWNLGQTLLEKARTIIETK